jgi:hypothetical protein
MTIESEKIVLTEREKGLFDEVLESAEQADEYFADRGCDTCPLRLACKGYEEGDCAFANILHELYRIERVIEVK